MSVYEKLALIIKSVYIALSATVIIFYDVIYFFSNEDMHIYIIVLLL